MKNIIILQKNDVKNIKQNYGEKMTVKLIHGDCIEEMHKLIEDDIKVDLVLTDLPYGLTDNSWDNIIPFEKMWFLIDKLTYARTPILFFASQPFTSKLVMSNLKWFRYEWIYQKIAGSNFGTVKYQPMKEHEEILVFGEKLPNYYPIKEPRQGSGAKRVEYNFKTSTESSNYRGSLYKNTPKNQDKLRNPSSVRLINNRKKEDRGLHPTQKPVELLKYLIKTYTNENDTVLDFTMGSGSTGVACLQTQRNFIGIEIEEKYYNIAKKRCKEYQSKLI